MEFADLFTVRQKVRKRKQRDTMKFITKMMLPALCAMLLFSAMGCSSGSSSAAPSSAPLPSNKDTNLLDRASKLLQAEGREYDKVYTAAMNETLTCSFFDFTITSAETQSQLGEYTPQQDGYQFLVTEVTVKNITKEAIPVGNYDFYVLWNGGQDASYTAFLDDMYPDDISLEPGKTLSGKLVFEIPVDAADVMIGYDEVWDDEFVGSSYMIGLQMK